MLFDITDIDPVIGMSPLVTVDTSPIGKSILIGAANGHVHVKDLHLTLMSNPEASAKHHESHHNHTVEHT
jgi:hypothetical protein